MMDKMIGLPHKEVTAITSTTSEILGFPDVPVTRSLPD